MLAEFKIELSKYINKEKAKFLPHFFKTGKGEYGEGDEFLGIVVPDQRIAAKKYYDKLSLKDLHELLNTKVHEYRLTALLMLVLRYVKARKDEKAKKEIYDFYLDNTKNINNWDLVDLTAPNIIGENLLKHPEKIKILYTLANSSHLWEKRIAVLSTFAFIISALSVSIPLTSCS